MVERPEDDFSREATSARPTFVSELLELLRHNRKWWLGPLIVVVLLLGVLMMLSSTAAAPFIYTLF